MATFPRITSRSSSLAGTRSSDGNGYFIRPPRTPYPSTSSDEDILDRSITSSSEPSSRYDENIPQSQSTTNSLQSLPPSPLDNIPSNLYARFPRFSMVTENSQPDLSIEDVTSTRFSVDEEGIVAIPYSSGLDSQKSKRPSKIHRTIRKAMSHQTMFLKRARVGVKRMPSTLGLVSEQKDKFGPPASLSSQEVRMSPRLCTSTLTSVACRRLCLRNGSSTPSDPKAIR